MESGATVMARHWSIKGTVGSWQAGAQNNPADVQTVREMLTIVSRTLNNAIIFNPFGITGQIEKPPAQSQAVRAINAFQKEVLLMAMPDGLVEPNGATFKGLYNVANSDLTKLYAPAGVDTKLRHGIVHLIAHVGSAVVTSGKRTVEEQADAMLKMDSDQLEMYCKNGTPDYIPKLRALIADKKYTKENVVPVLTEALKNHYISHHLKGHAVDISDHRGDFRRPPQSLANKYGVKIFDCTEERKMSCCHFQLINPPRH
jgi:hypothetical protein